MKTKAIGLAGVVALLMQIGCISSAVMDTGRVLEEGERKTTSGFSAGIQQGAMVPYEVPETGESIPDAAGGRYPPFTQQLEWMVRSMRGVGGGMQVDLGIVAPMPLGLGLEAGLKWQLPVGGDLVALAVATRGGGTFAGFGDLDDGVALIGGLIDGGIIASLHPHRDHAIYISPRARLDGVYHRGWSGGRARGATGRGLSWGSALGWRIGTFGRGSYFIESVVIHSPNPDGEDGLRVTFGLGVREDPERAGYLPW